MIYSVIANSQKFSKKSQDSFLAFSEPSIPTIFFSRKDCLICRPYSFDLHTFRMSIQTNTFVMLMLFLPLFTYLQTTRDNISGLI